MKKMLKRVWNTLKESICKHEFRYVRIEMVFGSAHEVALYKCKKCGKEKLCYVCTKGSDNNA